LISGLFFGSRPLRVSCFDPRSLPDGSLFQCIKFSAILRSITGNLVCRGAHSRSNRSTAINLSKMGKVKGHPFAIESRVQLHLIEFFS